jgi:hypothetical protein
VSYDFTCCGGPHAFSVDNPLGHAVGCEFHGITGPGVFAEPVVDMVNHPPHYTTHPSGVECIQVVEHMGFNLGNAIKYIWRADAKGDAVEDLRKAAWYIEREIQRRGAGAS